MRSIALLTACAVVALMTGAPAASAGPLGGLGGGFGGGIGGGAFQGGFGGSLGGQVQLAPGQVIDPITGRVREVRSAMRQSVQEKRRVVPNVSANVAIAAAPLVTTTGPAAKLAVAPIGAVVVAAPPPVVDYNADVNIDRRQQVAAFYAGGVTELPAPDAYVYMDRQADDLRRELAGTGVVVERQGEAIVLQLPGDVTFAFDKSDIRDRFFPVLSVLAQTLNDYPATFVDVIGHTDAVGSAAYNQGLSERRAGAVADFIQRRESIPARLYVAGRGKSEPVATNATVQGRAENRRVEILLHPYTAG